MPNVEEISKWAVIACDQFTSQPEYWEDVKNFVGDSPSAYNLILPEAMLQNSDAKKISQINASMNEYLEKNLFTEYKNSYVYVERTLLDGSIRKGIVGVIDLEEYDYKPGSNSKIRATEETVSERIPPRKSIRENAQLELSHVILLCDDDRRDLIEPITFSRHSMKKIYDFDLMFGGGNIKGWLIRGDQSRALSMRIDSYVKRKSKELSVVFAVGDGNHSLAAAKACYESGATSRYAMVELENIYDDALKFEPIHRLIKNIPVEEVLNEIQGSICVSAWGMKDSWPIKFYSREKSGIINIDKTKGASALIVLQKYLDDSNRNFEIDYIHDTDALKKLSSLENFLGFELPPFDENAKRDFFKVISKSGVLPRKTFSMGHAQEKRYYLEARKIK
ncbi:MAG: DUF1015 domain-containing protein [Synergistaceae bacterium]|nr:DUF1015 domain-containing protein [Synergistaceae bacterium]